MSTIEIILVALAGLCFAFTTLQVVKTLRLRRLTDVAEATVVKLRETHPGKKKGHAWGEVSYKVDGRTYHPDRMIDVIPGTKIGDMIKIVYFRDEPEKILNSPLRNALIVLLLGLAFLTVGLYL